MKVNVNVVQLLECAMDSCWLSTWIYTHLFGKGEKGFFNWFWGPFAIGVPKSKKDSKTFLKLVSTNNIHRTNSSEKI